MRVKVPLPVSKRFAARRKSRCRRSIRTAKPSPAGEQKALFPLIRTFVLEHAVVDAESAIPATRTTLVLDDHVDLSRHQSPEWRRGLYRRGTVDNPVLRTLCGDSFTHAELPTAIVLTSDYWTNWAHFLTEILPKALIAERRAQWRDWPMLISSSRLRNAEELLRLLLMPDRRIVKAYGRTRIDEAGYVSSVGFCPLEYVYDARTEFPDMRPTDCIFSPYALEMVRAAAKRLAPPAADSAPSYLYLRRSSNIRQLLNQDEVERQFSARGFKIVAPEKLSVMQQIELFSRARVIAGPAGAALANLVFAPPGCQLLILAAMTRHSAFHYWLNMADAAGHHAQYVFGRAVGPSPHPAHPDMHIDDLPRLGRIIDTAMGKVGSS
jgi:capsular polysaccharide biosynthesis protein